MPPFQKIFNNQKPAYSNPDKAKVYWPSLIAPQSSSLAFCRGKEIPA